MSDTRMKNQNWELIPLESGKFTPDLARVALAMDIRDELQNLNSNLGRLGGIQKELRGLRRDIKKLYKEAK